MNKNNWFFLLIVLLGGCVSRYKVTPLKSVSRKTADFVEERAGVEILLQQLDLVTVSKLFNSRLRNSRNQTIYPLLLTVHNKSKNKLLLKNKNIGLNLFTAQQLLQKLSLDTSSTIMSVIATVPLVIVGSFLLGWGILIATVPFGGASGFMILPFVGLGVGVGIPVVVDTASSNVSRFNRILSQDLKRKVLNGTSIKPFEKETVLFFASHIPKNFKISLMKESSEEKIEFNVNLKKEKS